MAEPIDLHEIAHRERERQGQYPWRVKVCSSTACLSAGAGKTKDAIVAAVEAAGLGNDCQVVPTGCLGPCSRGPLVRVEPRGEDRTLYGAVTAEEGTRIVTEHIVGGRPADDLLVDESAPFFARQHRVVLANAGKIDPERLEDYITEGGYSALEKAITTMTPADVLAAVKESGLRGRGGGGFPTGRKWELLASAPGPEKYVIANGDEGDPGAFMDRTVMEDDPHRVIEGVALACYATGASNAYLYVRAEYPRAVEHLETALRAARRNRLLGKGIFGSDFNLTIQVRIGAGAFVCGEETGLIASIEGRRGTPRLRPPYPTEKGLFGKPSMVNNVETLANLPAIIMNGAAWFRALGTEGSPGTKVFALAGDVVNTGLIEVPLGITLREIIEEIGGGVPGGKAFKAAQTGGPSGGCIPSAHLDTPVDYESLKALGSIMGSGGLIVIDETAKMPEVARFFMQFCTDESCGQCVPCRAGTVQLLGILDRLCRREGRPVDLELLTEISQVVRDASLCALGKTAANPVSSTMQYFRSEYEALVEEAARA